MASESAKVCLLLSGVACIVLTMHAGFKARLAAEAEAAANDECVVIELPNPLETCDMVDEPYLHCRNGTFYDPSGSGDPRLRRLCAKIKYRELRYDANGNAITYDSLRGVKMRSTVNEYLESAGLE